MLCSHRDCLLYILYIDSCRSAHADRFLVKFADDSALLSKQNHWSGTIKNVGLV